MINQKPEMKTALKNGFIMNKNETLRRFIIAFVLTLFFIDGYCQTSYIKNRWNFKVSYAKYLTGRRIGDKNETTGKWRFEGNYGILNFIETGVYFGFSNFQTSYPRDTYLTPSYGINVNLHIIPMFIKANDFRFDLYLSGKYGGRYITTPSNYFIHGHYDEYGIGGGISFYLWDHIGIFTEYSFGKYHLVDFGKMTLKDNTKFRYGLTFKF